MAIDTYLIGNDGNVSFSIGGTTQSIFKVRSFAATLARPVSDLTSFGDTGRRKRLGMLDLTGTMNAVFGVDATASSVNTAYWAFSSQEAAQTQRPAVTLTLYDGTGTADAKIVANCVFSQYAFNAAKDGDTTVTVNFENADGTAPVVSWLV
jgi:hypothetical protein